MSRGSARSRLLHVGVLPVVAAVLVTCDGGGSSAVANPAEADAAPPPFESDDATWVFDEDAVREYRLELPPDAWDALRASARDEQYTPARLSVDGTEFGEVGLRFKGSIGTLRNCTDTRGNLLCFKLSMKIRFDEYREEQRFFGLKRLNFNSMRSDPSELHERLAYRLFREMGIAAPRAAHARLTVNGEALGVFTLVEQIDGRFTDARFADGDGNLYKEQWPITTSAAVLDTSLETNEGAPDHSALIQFREELAAASLEALPETVARYMDVDELLAYLAVDRVITNWDGFTGFYCRGGGCYNHNFYLYQHEHAKRFSLIPWDLDNTFRTTTPYEAVPMPLAVPDDCSARFPIFGSVRAMAPGCDPVFMGLARVDPGRYDAQVDRLLAGPFDVARLNAWIDARLAQLTEHVAADTHGPSLPGFVAAVEVLRNDLGVLAERVLAERNRQVLPRFRLRLHAVNDFESTRALELHLGVIRERWADSQIFERLSEGAALDGARHLEVRFTHTSSLDGESAWARLRLPLEGELVDLTSVRSVRMLLASDAPRSVRIGIDSPAYSDPGKRTVFGWDVTLDGTPQSIELPLSEADYPSTGPAVPETLGDVLRQATALLIEPQTDVPVQAPGAGAAHPFDSGVIGIDRIEFVGGGQP